MLIAKPQYMLRLKHLVHGTMPFPQQDFGLFDLLRGKPAHRLIEVPHRHLIHGDAELMAAPAAQVLIRKKQYLFPARKRPLQNLYGIAGSANNAAVLATKGFKVGGG